MKRYEDRCDHCGRFVTIQHAVLYTLFEGANGHPHEEDVAICERCSEQYDADYWERWLNARFADAARSPRDEGVSDE